MVAICIACVYKSRPLPQPSVPRAADHAIAAVHYKMPGASMPVIEAREVENARRANVERHVEIIGFLIQKVARIRSLIPTLAVVRAPHVRALSDPLLRPTIPHTVSVEADWQDGRLLRLQRQS